MRSFELSRAVSSGRLEAGGGSPPLAASSSGCTCSSVSTKNRYPLSVGIRPGRGVRGGDEAQLLEIGHHVADGGRGKLQARLARQRARADRLAVADVALDEDPQQVLRPLAELLFAAFYCHRSRTPCDRKLCDGRRRPSSKPLAVAATIRRDGPLRPQRARWSADSSDSRVAESAQRLCCRISRPGRLRCWSATTRGCHAGLRAGAAARARGASSAARADLMIAIGGDGTLLYAAGLVARHGVPLLGINRGRLGFLTDVMPQDMLGCVDAALEGGLEADERPLLAALPAPSERRRRGSTRAQRRSAAEAWRPGACWISRRTSTADTSTRTPATASSSRPPPARPPMRSPAAVRSSSHTWRRWSSRRSARIPSPTGRSWCPRAR